MQTKPQPLIIWSRRVKSAALGRPRSATRRLEFLRRTHEFTRSILLAPSAAMRAFELQVASSLPGNRKIACTRIEVKYLLVGWTRPWSASGLLRRRSVFSAGQRRTQAVEIDIHNRRGEQRKRLADDDPSHNRDSKGSVQLGTCSGAERQRKASQQRRRRCHHDGTEA